MRTQQRPGFYFCYDSQNPKQAQVIVENGPNGQLQQGKLALPRIGRLNNQTDYANLGAAIPIWRSHTTCAQFAVVRSTPVRLILLPEL